MQSKLTEERAAEAARLVAEGLTLDAAAERLGVHRRTILSWAERDPAVASTPPSRFMPRVPPGRGSTATAI
jgi:transposase